MIYIFSQDNSFLEELKSSLPAPVETFSEEARFAGAIAGAPPRAVLFDCRLTGSQPKILERIYLEYPTVPVITFRSQHFQDGDILSDRVLIWPGDPAEAAAAISEIESERADIASCGLVGRSHALASAARIVTQVAPSDINVLITGPSGAGKEMIARALHAKSGRPGGPFIAVNVAALAPGIIESELFGHERGAFTGAAARRIGVFEQASGGMIFLDEIGEIPLEIQAKLLRILEQRTFTRVGGNVSIRANFRLVAATNRDLADDVSYGKFREDLYYRLKVVTINLPSLAERKADIAPLAFYFLGLRGKELKTDRLLIEPGALRQFHRYDWPGNVRELKNVIDSFAVTSPTGHITASDFERYMMDNSARSTLLPVVTHRTPEAAEHQLIFQALMTLTNELVSLKNLILHELDRGRGDMAFERTGQTVESINVEDMERGLVSRALSVSGGNRKKAAKMLGIGERTLYRKIEKYGLK